MSERRSSEAGRPARALVSRVSRRGWVGRVAVLALGASAGWLGARRTEAAAPLDPGGGWETAFIERRDVGGTVLATGVIRPRVGAQVAVGSRASGLLRRLYVTVGDRVQAGQLLAELDRVEFETQVDRAAAQQASAASDVLYAERELQRLRQLFERGVTASAEVEAAERQAASAQARQREAQAAHAAAVAQLGYTSIRAPITGVVASVSTQEGETVAASFAAPTFVTIVDLSRLEVWAYVDETDVGRVQPGQRATFRVDTWPDDVFAGRVTAIRPTAELRDNVVNYVTLIEIENRPDRLFRPEMTATVNVHLDAREQVVAVPNAALRRDAGGTFVLVPAAAGPQRRDLAVGFRGADYTEVLAGVAAGDAVIIGTARECAQPLPSQGAQ